MKIELVEWQDAHSSPGWQKLDDLEDNCVPLYCRSVGWVVNETDEYIIIVPHLSGEANKNPSVVLCGRGDITIPKGMILKRTIIKGVK